MFLYEVIIRLIRSNLFMETDYVFICVNMMNINVLFIKRIQINKFIYYNLFCYQVNINLIHL